MPAFHVENFGCRATQADGAALERQFEEHGLTRAHATQADIVVLNTCTVTASADQDARAAIRRVQRQNPRAKIIVTGCYAQRAPEEIAAIPGVSCVVGNSHKHRLAEITLGNFFQKEGRDAENYLNTRGDCDGEEHDFSRAVKAASDAAFTPEVNNFFPLTALSGNGKLRTALYVSDIFAHTELLAAPVFDAANERTRPNLKIQDGCDNRCSFCVIPYVRGQSRSLPQGRIIAEVKALVAVGYRELVISGINLGRWGKDLALSHETSAFSQTERPLFEDLLRSILDQTTLEKLRISSVEPMDWSDELISIVARSPRIAKHAHVPMQSGSDAVLRRMHRKYRPWHYREKIEKIRAAMPTAAIGADVMTGFPGETEAEFESTRRMIEDLPFTYLHVFTFSARPGTPAATMANQVPVHIARKRNRILRDLAAKKKQTFMESFVGKKVDAITLSSTGRDLERAVASASPTNPKYTDTLTDNFLSLRLVGQHEPNRWLVAQVENVVDGALVGFPLAA